MKRRKPCLVAVLSIGFVTALAAQEPPATTSGTDHVTAIKQSLQTSMVALQEFQWVETTVVSLKGEEKSRTQNSCQYFILSGHAQALIAEVDGEPLAGLILFIFANKAWYLYGMSRQVQREKMPNYLLQWHAICRARGAGCRSYDLWGAPDKFDVSYPMWGVYRFKVGLGGNVVRSFGAWDFPIRPFWYRIYTTVLPRILNRMRIRGRSQTEQTLGA